MAVKTHIVRLAGTNKAGDVLPDIWVDIERIHQFPMRIDNVGSYPNSSQVVTKYLFWNDDPGYEDYEPEDQMETVSGRTNVILKVCSHDEENINDPEEWVPVKIISQMKMKYLDREQQLTFRVAEPDMRDVRRIVHYDTIIDKDATAAFDEGKKAYVVASYDYRITGEKDKDEDQYIEEQIINNYKARISEDGSQDQEITVYFDKRHPLIDDEANPAPDAKLEEFGEEGINPPYRLDPFQAVINVQFSTKVYIVFVTNIPDMPYFPDADNPKAKILETRTHLFEETLYPVRGTLLECSANAGKEFLAFDSTYDDTEVGVESYWIFTIPHKKENVADWFQHYVLDLFRPVPGVSVLFYPWQHFIEMNVLDPQTVSFNLERIRHLATKPPPGSKAVDLMSMLWPNGGAGANWTGSYSVSGYRIGFYRLDKEATGTIYQIPPEWEIVVMDSNGQRGLSYGQKPPATVGADVPAGLEPGRKSKRSVFVAPDHVGKLIMESK